MIKILVAAPIKADATSFYRCFGPINHLQKNYDVSIIDATMPGYELTWDVVQQADVVFIQRPSTGDHTTLMNIAKLANVPIWIDFDDDYLSIPETNPRYELYAEPHRVECIRKAMECADLITVSTVMIREQIHKHTGKDKKTIHVIPNAIDEQKFDCSIPGPDDLDYQRNVVMWRGGDTHGHDIDPYLDKMVSLYNEYQEYTWAFFGYAPEKFLNQIDNKRVILYPWGDVMKYFDSLFEMRPKVTIVPWANLEFNASKSNCSWLESTLAGAATVFPRWSSEYVRGMAGYNSPEEFYKVTGTMLNNPSLFRLNTKESFESLQNYTLGAVNKVRYDLIKSLCNAKRPLMGYRADHMGTLTKQYTPDEYYKFTFEKMINTEYDFYKENYFKAADFLIETFSPVSVMEIGSGPGALMERMLDKKVPGVIGFDSNENFKHHWDIRNPHYTPNYLCKNIVDVPINGVFDLGVSIEVFDYLQPEVCDALIARLANHCKRIYFSSYPYRESISEDKRLGRINIRTFNHWITTFEENGWKYESTPQKIGGHDQIFVSQKIKSQK